MNRPQFGRTVILISSILLAGCAVTGGESAGEVSAPNRIRVGILIYEGVFNTEFIAPLDVFDHTAGRTEGKLEVFTVSPTDDLVTTAEGLRVQADYSFKTSPPIDWLVVPSGEHYRTDVDNKELVGWIRGVGDHAQVIHSNCWGAILLAGAGLLDDRHATTFPASTEEFAEMFPRVKVEHDATLVEDSGAITTAGGVLSYDGALYLVEKEFGLETARGVAEGLVIDWDARREALQKAVF